MSLPLVTIITVVFNSVDTIEQTILSVINQSYSNLEYIIIDGASTDGTIDVIKKYENRIKYWISEPDKGIYDAMNKGINKASGEWLNFMNAGDWFYSAQTIEQVFNNTGLENVEMIYGNTEKRKGNSSSIHKPGHSENFWKQLMVHQSMFTRTDLNKKYLFDVGFKVAADFDFIYKTFFFKHKTLYIDNIISSFDMVGYSHGNRYIGFAEDRKIAMKYKGRPALSLKVYMFYVRVTILGKLIDILKKHTPFIYKKLKNIKDKV
ncbi:glycosyltransferase family 2 protein [Mucilaginibacter sp. KACC 22063]|uniref:glycosyltransferase family 2 protein n=1 Tax=Mucilaginibacter sp. KACC 22063 TaxID=3025666 RepID=UPI002365B17F|nr:glycosyltransferase family 2 protein [Mucilaginibacter sp. KACC 22063]WDF54711.1 glycosyltransferase family 2 protein [Mucilaginibacter sp. KACC 22063]